MSSNICKNLNVILVCILADHMITLIIPLLSYVTSVSQCQFRAEPCGFIVL